MSVYTPFQDSKYVWKMENDHDPQKNPDHLQNVIDLSL